MALGVVRNIWIPSYFIRAPIVTRRPVDAVSQLRPRRTRAGLRCRRCDTVVAVARWKQGVVITLTRMNGLPCDEMISAARDRRDTLWLYAKCGLLAVDAAELERWSRHPDTAIRYRLFDVVDGAMPSASSFQPNVSVAPDGRLWFANDAVVQTVDPEALRPNTVAPPVFVEALRAGRRDYTIAGLVNLPARSRDIEIAYTALSFAVPEKVRFRYRLEGRDQAWSDADTRRQAFYSDLPPGRYRFHVTAANNDGVWNEQGAMLTFMIAPAYYQTAWFSAVVLVAGLSMLWALYRIRLRQLAHEFDGRLQERVAERTRIARQLHDTLLQSFQGLMLRLQVVDDLLPAGSAKHQLDEALDRADQAIAEGRDAVWDLRDSAAATNDLAQAVRALGEELATPDSAAFHLVVEGTARDLNPLLRDEVYCITREALRNAFRHARARRIETDIVYGDQAFRVRVRDDGEGIHQRTLHEGRAGHYGLRGMRERAQAVAGTLDIWSRPGSGTEIDLRIAAASAYGSPTHPRWLGFVPQEAGDVILRAD